MRTNGAILTRRNNVLIGTRTPRPLLWRVVEGVHAVRFLSSRRMGKCLSLTPPACGGAGQHGMRFLSAGISGRLPGVFASAWLRAFMNDPLPLMFGLGVAAYLTWLWWGDLMRRSAGVDDQIRALPGATPAGAGAIFMSIGGAVILVGLETLGELRLGIAGEQTKITVLFALYSVMAASILEELIFRGFFVVENKGRVWLIGGATVTSIFFAIAHPHLWQWQDGSLSWHFGAKGWFSTGALFTGSLWFYACRFAAWNPSGSLLPCFAAHAAKNFCVVAIKAGQGFVIGLW